MKLAFAIHNESKIPDDTYTKVSKLCTTSVLWRVFYIRDEVLKLVVPARIIVMMELDEIIQN